MITTYIFIEIRTRYQPEFLFLFNSCEAYHDDDVKFRVLNHGKSNQNLKYPRKLKSNQKQVISGPTTSYGSTIETTSRSTVCSLILLSAILARPGSI